MPTQLQLRGGTTTQNASFTGLAREVTVNTTKHTLIVHDGTTAGGHELALADLSNVSGSFGATYGISAEIATGGVNLRLTGSNSTTDDVKLAAGSNISLVRTDANTITIASTGTGVTYGISAETATGGVNLRLTGSNAVTDDVKLAAGSNITLTRTDANTITIASTGGGGSGSGTVNTGAATALAYYPSAGTTVDDISAITWTAGTTTLTVVGTVAADNFVSSGTGTPNFSSDTDLEIITDANGTPKTFTFDLAGGFRVGEIFSSTPVGKVFEIEGGTLDRLFRAQSNMSSYSSTSSASVELESYRSTPANGDVGVSIDFRQSVTASPNFVAASIFSKVTDITSASEDTTLNFKVFNAGSGVTPLIVTGGGITVAGAVTFGSTAFRVVGTVPTSSIGAVGDKAGDVAMNGTSMFYCTANYDGIANIWVKSTWATTGAW